MGQIFISYSSKDADFALKLFKSLQPFYDVWIDQDDIKGGAKWEQLLKDAITNCDVFLVVVSSNSNNSDWVRRETILADRLNKFRIPIMLNDDMPLRLLDLQYIDFRGDYSGGLRDLLAVLQTQIKTHDSDESEINRLIGSGVLAYFAADGIGARNQFDQVSILQPDLEQQLSQLDNWLRTQYGADETDTKIAEQVGQLSILEKSRILPDQRYGNDTTIGWSLELDEEEATLSKVEFVKYILHPTFQQRERIVRDRESRFRLETIGWGTFLVEIEIQFVDDSLLKQEHMLTFDEAYE